MDNYIVSARKYRPSTFQSVVGQKSLTTTLKNAIYNNKLAHAYLFCGPRGVGKTTCARIFAKTINCLNATPEGEACNACESCCSFNEQRSYNIHELDAASNNSVDDIRSLIEQVRIPPQIGQYKVYIIDEVHMLSSQAFNAFLKTLEEPPHHAVFVLATTEKHKILATILSRCQIYDFSRISINDTVEHLQYVAQQEGVRAEVDALNVIAQKADGGMRDALSIFDQVVSFTGGDITYRAVIENLNVLDYEYYFKLTDAILQGKVPESILILNEILNKGFDGQHIVTGLASHFRDLMVCKDSQTIVLFEAGDSIKQKYVDFSARCTVEFLYKALEWTNECDLNYRQSKNKRLLVEILLIRLCQYHYHPESIQDDKKKITLEPIGVAGSGSAGQPATTQAASPQAVQSQPAVAQAAATQVAAVQPSAAQPTAVQSPAQPPSQEEKKTVSPVAADPAAAAKKAPIIKGKKLGVSLKNTHGNEESSVQTQTTKVTQVLDFTQDALVFAWLEYAQQHVGDQVHLQNTMRNSLPVLVEKYVFEVLVYNPEQENKLKEQATGILEFLRFRLNNAEVRMEVKISEENVKQLAYTDKEKFQKMAELNPGLLSLTKEFQLKLD